MFCSWLHTAGLCKHSVEKSNVRFYFWKVKVNNENWSWACFMGWWFLLSISYLPLNVGTGSQKPVPSRRLASSSPQVVVVTFQFSVPVSGAGGDQGRGCVGGLRAGWKEHVMLPTSCQLLRIRILTWCTTGLCAAPHAVNVCFHECLQKTKP